MTTGVRIPDECVQAYDDMKQYNKYGYIVYRMDNKLTEVKVEAVGPSSASYNDFVEELMKAKTQMECRYGLFMAEYGIGQGHTTTAVVFFLWCPEEANIRQKMVFASTKGAFKRNMQGLEKEIQASSRMDLAWTNVMNMLLTQKQTQW